MNTLLDMLSLPIPIPHPWVNFPGLEICMCPPMCLSHEYFQCVHNWSQCCADLVATQSVCYQPCKKNDRNYINKHLYVEQIVTFPVKITFPIPVWVVGNRDKCPIHKTPSTPPGPARMSLDPVLCVFLFRSGLETHNQLLELWMEDGCHNPTSDEMDHPLGDTGPVCDTLKTGTISVMSKPV